MTTQEQREVFRRALQAARSDAGLSQRELAAKVGVSYSAVSQWEMGTTAPRQAKLRELERTLGLEDGDLGQHLGFLSLGAQERALVTVADAIEKDPRLGERQRELLRTMYRELVRQHADEVRDGG